MELKNKIEGAQGDLVFRISASKYGKLVDEIIVKYLDKHKIDVSTVEFTIFYYAMVYITLNSIFLYWARD